MSRNFTARGGVFPRVIGSEGKLWLAHGPKSVQETLNSAERMHPGEDLAQHVFAWSGVFLVASSPQEHA